MNAIVDKMPKELMKLLLDFMPMLVQPLFFMLVRKRTALMKILPSWKKRYKSSLLIKLILFSV